MPFLFDFTHAARRAMADRAAHLLGGNPMFLRKKQPSQKRPASAAQKLRDGRAFDELSPDEIDSDDAQFGESIRPFLALARPAVVPRPEVSLVARKALKTTNAADPFAGLEQFVRSVCRDEIQKSNAPRRR
jgi:hypothetical protein